MLDTLHPGQRWVSESEPELGLGSILSVTHRTVTLIFKASGQRREYARRNAPLHRIRFRTGDKITTHEGTTLKVDDVAERDGLLIYHCGSREVPETDLSDTITFNTPEERLFGGQIDPPAVFDLRASALHHQYRRRKSKVRGFVGGRIDLIPHQLYIASEVANRLLPRVLLADEVGLGKTIEACLILHRLVATGRIQRVLVLVPDSLIHQWFVELLRRFNLWFHIFDEERCVAIEETNPGENPFLEGQYVVSSIRLFTANEQRIEQALAAGWDMLVVDEAHHLAWSPHEVSPEYALVEALSRKTPGLLLLTATPEQLGMESHFARLRLLDPDRFYDLDEFLKESDRYAEVVFHAESLPEGKPLQDLLDRHGTGRVRFRNTRAAVAGFPNRLPRLAPLEPDVVRHPMLDWLANLLLTIDPEKILLICRTQARVAAIDAALRQRVKNVKIAVFHEGLSLVQRDRNAAWFAEKDGARILICSEIGSEGRNFQFAHHLVLFDLPLDPELLEQRIGRLDRIGQTSEIHVHVPYVVGSSHEVLVRWYQEALNAFEKNLQGGPELLDRFGARLYDLAQRFSKGSKSSRVELERLIEETRVAHQQITERLRSGRDRLLELNSFRPEVAAAIVADIRKWDDDRSIDEFMLAVFDEYSIHVQDIADRTYRLGSAGVLAESFPGLPAEGFTVTCDRARAIAREDIQFLTWDHPLATGALDLLLGSEKGNCSFAEWADSKEEGLYLEVIYVLECIAPTHLQVDRFLPPTPVRIVVDDEGKQVRERMTLTPGDGRAPLEHPELRDLFPFLVECTKTIAEEDVRDIVLTAQREMAAQLDSEILRLRELKKVNRSVRTEEIELLLSQRRALDALLSGARLRLDSIRWIHRRRF